MIPKPILHKWLSDDENHLGFVCINIYERPNKEFELMDAINSSLLYENHFAKELKTDSVDTDIYGPFKINKLAKSDFIEVDSTGLKDCFEKFWSEPDWGEDLPIFKELYRKTEEFLKHEDLKTKKNFFICKNWTNHSKLIMDEDFFIYLVCVISVSDDKITVITYGAD